MTEHSPRLDLPYLQPAQAQKHVTVNEALERLDALTQLVVQAFDAQTPPPAAEPGQIWALGAAPTDVWNGQVGHLAIATPGNGWLFVLPEAGWRAFGLAENQLRVFGSGGWVNAQPQRVDTFGVNADASETNRLSVMAPATLLTHEGAGHQLKVNKAGVADTASLVFQTNWTGHAEMGLAGNNEFSIKVSPDGGNWTTALSVNPANGHLLGDAVQSDPMDATPGRLLTNGAFGLGQPADLPGGSFDHATAPGFYAGFAGTHATTSAGDNPFPTASDEVSLFVAGSSSGWTQIASQVDAAAPRLRVRGFDAAQTGAWVDIATSASAGGTLDQGGVVERSDSANGSVIKYADGTQVCTIKRLELTRRTANNCHGAWSFPAAFLSADQLTISACLVAPSDADDPAQVAAQATPSLDAILAPMVGTLTASQVECAVYRAAGQTDFGSSDKLYVCMTATGRWK